jgi:FO synthase
MSRTFAIADLSDRPLSELIAEAGALRDAGHGRRISYSRKVFLPLTHLCRDVCRYCTFAKPPRKGQAVYMSLDEVLAVARDGQALGCKEALFTLGDQPEVRWPAARAALDEMGFGSTLDYLGHVAERVFDETGLLPHLNPGLMSPDELQTLRRLAPSMGIMLESASPRLMERGGPHFGCPDKAPEARLAVIEAAGRLRIPFTSGLLIGIGETREERLEALLELKALHDRYGHIQEIIVQPFRAKPGTRMAKSPEPSLDDLLWTLAAARLMFGPEANIQSPPNLAPGDLPRLIEAGINDFGGVSPLTPDFVNPEAPWPELEALGQDVAACGHTLVERLTVYPAYARAPDQWIDARLAPAVRAATDADGWPREDGWQAGRSKDVPAWARAPNQDLAAPGLQPSDDISLAMKSATAGTRLAPSQVAQLFTARGDDFRRVCERADALRREVAGDAVTYVVTRNINYTNVCTYRCGFCAFSKGRVAPDLRSAPYQVELDEISRRTAEAWDRGATEVCLQGGIHPAYTGHTYLEILAAAKQGAPQIHVHAFSPLEVTHGATSLGVSIGEFLTELKRQGLGSLPGTAAEVLDDEVRQVICPDKLTAQEWLDVVRTAHEVGLRTTSTIMFGHVDGRDAWARHLLALRDLQAQTGGLTEFVPLPFVADEAPIYRKGLTRRGPTYREAVLMHAVARLVLHPLIRNIQVSWVKMGPQGAAQVLCAGANDLGGTLMNETITRSAGAQHGQEFSPAGMEALIQSLGRTPRLRTTLYGAAGEERRAVALAADPLTPVQQTPVGRKTLAKAAVLAAP